MNPKQSNLLIATLQSSPPPRCSGKQYSHPGLCDCIDVSTVLEKERKELGVSNLLRLQGAWASKVRKVVLIGWQIKSYVLAECIQ